MDVVESLIQYVGNGVTEPVLANLQINELAILKYGSNIQGKRILFNEFACYLLANELNITIPISGICKIVPETFCKENNLKLQQIIDDNMNELCFFSKAILKSTRVNAGILQEIDNKDIFEKILLFDHIVYNKDRNEGNLLVTTNKEEKIIYMIDHTHVFKNQTIWDKFCLRQGMEISDYMDNDIMCENKYYYDMFFAAKDITYSSLLKCANLFQSKINLEKLDELFEKVPMEWRVNDEDIEELKKYLIYRLEHIEDIIKVILINK